jgi:methionyl-tRNA formyltransferase
MKKVFFLLNDFSEYNFYDLVKKYLVGISVTIGESLPPHSEDYDLIILWRYRKIIPHTKEMHNIIIFHSTDLPEGRGWAPIYYTLANDLPYYVISGILAGEGADTGDVIVKAKFKIKDDYTAEIIRKWDDEISILLVKKILTRFVGRPIRGVKQVGEPTYYPRRKPEDNEVALEAPLGKILTHLRACEKRHPAFFYYNQTKYRIHIEPVIKPEFPSDLKVTFFDDSQWTNL